MISLTLYMIVTVITKIIYEPVNADCGGGVGGEQVKEFRIEFVMKTQIYTNFSFKVSPLGKFN